MVTLFNEYHENQNRSEFLDTLFECYSESPHFEIESTFGNLNTIFLTKYLEFTRNERNLKAHSLTVALVKQFKKLTKSLFSCLFVSYIQKTIENFYKIYSKSHRFEFLGTLFDFYSDLPLFNIKSKYFENLQIIDTYFG